MRKLALALAVGLMTAPAIAEETTIAGSPVTAENMVDVLEIMRITDAMSNAVDAKDWDLVRSFTTDEITTTLGQDGVVTIPADDMIATFVTNMGPDAMASQHMRSNQRVFFHSPDEATMHSKGVILVTVSPGGEFADDGGTLVMQNFVSYEHGFVRTAEGWKVQSVLTEYPASLRTSLPAAE